MITNEVIDVDLENLFSADTLKVCLSDMKTKRGRDLTLDEIVSVCREVFHEGLVSGFNFAELSQSTGRKLNCYWKTNDH